MGLSFASVCILFWGGLSFHILQNGGQLCVFVLGVFNDLDYTLDLLKINYLLSVIDAPLSTYLSEPPNLQIFISSHHDV
jgi:hypothetical protein